MTLNPLLFATLILGKHFTDWAISPARTNHRKVGFGLFFHDRLIIGYIQEPQHNRYMFQLAGGEECPISREDFISHWQTYRRFEQERAEQHSDHYRPLPITVQIRRKLDVFPADVHQRRQVLKIPFKIPVKA